MTRTVPPLESWITALLVLAACLGGGRGGWAEEAMPACRFVRQGVWLAPELRGASIIREGREIECPAVELGDRGGLKTFSWQPGETYEVRPTGAAAPKNGPLTLVAPQRPVPVVVRRWPLEDVSAAALGGSWPDAAVRFSPDGRRLAVGSFGGWLRVFDVYSGQTLLARRLAEGLVKCLAWSPDGQTLYAGEQSPDALVWALAAEESSTSQLPWSVRWTVRLADWIETSRPPADDRFGVYSLPGIYDLRVGPRGQVLVAAVHSWTTDAGRLQNRSLVLALDPSGKPQWQFPSAGAAPLTITALGLGAAGRRLIVLPHQSQASEPSPEAVPGAVHLLDTQSGQVLDRQPISPLVPFFDRVEAWDSLAVSDDDRRAALGLSDGRALLWKIEGDRLERLAEFALGVPRVFGGVPVVAAVSYARFAGDTLLLQTQNAHIPFSHAQAALATPATHRGANTLSAMDVDGRPLWRFQSRSALGGQWASRPDASGKCRWLLVAARETVSEEEPSSLGAFLFDLERGGSGRSRLDYYYPTPGPPLFHADLSPDGRWAALVESPAALPAGGDVYGTYQVHVVH